MTQSHDDTSEKKWVQVVIQNSAWEEVVSFDGQPHKSFVAMAEEAWYEMPVSCCSGACFVCACSVAWWQDAVDIATLSVPLVDIESDQVLTCVWWIKEEYFSSWYHRIVLKQLL